MQDHDREDRLGRAGRGHRKRRRKAPVLAAAAAVVLVAGGGGTYALLSGAAPERIAVAVAGAPSALAGRPDPVVGGGALSAPTTGAASVSPSPAGSVSPSPAASLTAPAATASPSASASASAPARSSKAAASPARSSAPANGPTGPDPKVPGGRTSTQDVRTAQALSLELLNGERAAVGRPPLALRQDLSDFARKWAEHMRTSGFSHSSSEERAYLKTGTRSWTGENIVWFSDASMTAQEAAEKFQSMWRHSPGHYKAQVSPDFTEVGVGLYRDSSGWWGVHNFSDGR
ncbi:CAP domain-containing protein [Streptomyces goshikiensis]|uniref:CAP domain-containing protein n=1 Tax=Streptomyces goshikiensis TaxID=1942 RepID=UPI0036CB83B3